MTRIPNIGEKLRFTPRVNSPKSGQVVIVESIVTFTDIHAVFVQGWPASVPLESLSELDPLTPTPLSP
jgi:hypothetical protein